MKQQYENWLDFLVKNFKPGTATEISKHIAEEARKQNFMPNNKSIEAKVRQLLPMYTPGMFKESTKSRKLIAPIFININGIYDFAGNHQTPQLVLNKHKKVSTRTDDGTILDIKVPKDKGVKHNDILETIRKYADEYGYDFEPEKENIDLLVKNNSKYSINEVKSYKDSIFVAVGQVQFYKFNLIETFKINASDISALNIIGDFELPSKFVKFLKELNINYFNVKNDKIEFF